MQTLFLGPKQIGEAAGVIRRGGLLVFPTETVYGLGASAWDAEACRAIFTAKGRPADNPLIVHIATPALLGEVAAAVPGQARRLFDAFSPGPLTIILPRSPRIPDVVTAGLDTVGVRIPSHPVARSLLKAVGVPVAAPSANRSGRPSPTDFAAAVAQMRGRVDAILDGGECEHGLESTILRVVGRQVTVLREGAITREMIAGVLGDVPIGASADTGAAGGAAGGAEAAGDPETAGGAGVRSPAHRRPAEAPGMRHTHYRPEARVVTVTAGELPAALRRLEGIRFGYIGVTPLLGDCTTRPAVSVLASDLEDYARRLYRSFYLFDAAGCDVIVAELPASAGIGRALRDRLRRAAG
ncbi:MAG: threonylcarbamoyl-AMP synthase [Spirochaetes bacterium]|jgi:L-threonylcarbamoyladenylate synthase|nr:threonylcarbamoyl-AMP synthase [Spirochaetota bacterium]